MTPSDFHRVVLRGVAVLTLAALVQGGLVGTVLAVHAAHDDHDSVRHDTSACLELIVHGHDHDRGTPDHDHAFVSARQAPHDFERNDLLRFPLAASSTVIPSAPKIPLSSHRRTALSGPSPPTLNQTLVVLRI